MPTIQKTEDFTNGMSGGGSPFDNISGSPQSDTGIRHGSDPASLLLDSTSAAEWVSYNDIGSPTKPWMGFWWYLATADEPAGDRTVAFIDPVAGSAARLAYAPASNVLYWYLTGGGGFQNKAVTMDAWHWVEMIMDVASGTRTLNVRIDEVDGTGVSFAESASTAQAYALGNASADTMKFRYSYWNLGYASSTSDWSGPLSSLTLDNCLPDADVVTTGWTTTPLFSKVNDSSDATVIQATAS